MDPISRRRFLQAAALALPGATALVSHVHATAQSATAATLAAHGFLTDEEKRFLDAAVDRLIPGDLDNPGALQAGVTGFIDLQLAGPFGSAQTWYMQGPWREGTEQQGYQLKLTPAQLYRTAIRNIQSYCQQTWHRPFDALPGATRDEVLHGLEKGTIELADVPSKTFFDMLWQNTQEGFLADPMYGGNRDFAGWKLIGFPGPRYNYVDEIGQFGKPYTRPTVGLKGRTDPHGQGG
jgi:gluconate 2-dehydrogenase gamma chain